MGTKNKYDVIIIGAGIGGLTAGAILARNGKRVLILEKNDRVGGYAVNFKRNGFEFDASLHLMQGCGQGKITHNILSECGVLDKVRFVKPKYLYRTLFLNFDLRISQNNPNLFIKELKKHFPEEKVGIDALIREAKEILTEFEDFQRYGKMPMRLNCYLQLTCYDVFRKYISNNNLIDLLSQLWIYFGLPPRQLSAYYFPFLVYDYLYNGGYYPENGSGSISEALKDAILSYKGEIRLGAEVTKLDVSSGLVKSAIIKNGPRFLADAIVSNIDLRKTFFELVGPPLIETNLVKKLTNMKPSISAFQVYMGLDIPSTSLSKEDYEIFVYDNVHSLDNAYELFLANEVNKMPYCLALYSNVMSRPNRTELVIATLAGYDFWRNITPDRYEEMKNSFDCTLIKRAETIFPGLQSYIKFVDIATPLTIEKYTGNFKGAIYGWANVVDQCGSGRVFSKNPFKNLYLVGAWTYPGGGLSGVMFCGWQVARNILRK